MKLIPKYRVGYKGKFYSAGMPFDIEDADMEEMRRHGTVIEAEEKALSVQENEEPVSEGNSTFTEEEETTDEEEETTDEQGEKQVKARRGRARKEENNETD